jgi:putative IMPACT (imprinted ancient) family translation regulator
LESESYNTIAGPAEYIYKEKGSKFYAFAFPINSESELPLLLSDVKEKMPGATHYVYAMIAGLNRSLQKASDAGEPPNSAGKPVLRAILSAGVTDTCIIIARFFGGRKLGVPGLINAYEEAAKLCLRNAGVISKLVYDQYRLETSSEHEADAYSFIKKIRAEIISRNKKEKLVIIFSLARNEAGKLEECKKNYYFLHTDKIS